MSPFLVSIGPYVGSIPGVVIPMYISVLINLSVFFSHIFRRFINLFQSRLQEKAIFSCLISHRNLPCN